MREEYKAGILKNTFDFKTQSFIDVYDKVMAWDDKNPFENRSNDTDNTPSDLFPTDVLDAMDVDSDILSDIDATLIIAE